MEAKKESLHKTLKKKDPSSDNPSLIMGEDNFQFWNNDTYKGSFKATHQGDIYREGYGEYTTSDNQKYQGVWENDCIIENLVITFPDGSYYEGGDDQLSYSGPGSYVFPDKSTLKCTFNKNQPTAAVELVDPSGHLWHGEVQKNSVILFPWNIFIPPEDMKI